MLIVVSIMSSDLPYQIVSDVDRLDYVSRPAIPDSFLCIHSVLNPYNREILFNEPWRPNVLLAQW